MSKRESYERFGNGHAFEPHPDFWNHQCHWAPWAEHYRDDTNWFGRHTATGTLANMLGCSLEESERLLKRAHQFHKAYVILLWAWIDLVETGVPKPLVDDTEESSSMQDAFAFIKLINKWRAENKLNMKLVDVT